MKRREFEYSIGNSKIGKDTIIVNMGSATDCVSYKLGLCKIGQRICYAMKAERQYPSVLPYRRRQMEYWRFTAPADIAFDIYSIVKRHKGIKYVRFSEAGDFSTQRDVEKLFLVAKVLAGLRVVVYGYTARRDLDFTARPSNCVMQGSGFMIDNEFRVVSSYSKGAIRCKQDCRKCMLCKIAKGIVIENVFH